LINPADIKSAGGVAPRVRTQALSRALRPFAKVILTAFMRHRHPRIDEGIYAGCRRNRRRKATRHRAAHRIRHPLREKIADMSAFHASFDVRFKRHFAEQCYCLGPEILGGLAAAGGGGLGASSIIPLVASLGTSVLGGQMQAQAQQQQRDQQMQQNLAQEQARNSVLQNFLQTEKTYQQNNQNQLNTAIDADTQPKIAQTHTNAVNSRIQNADSSVGDVIKPAVAPTTPTGSTFNQNDLTARQNAGLQNAKAVTDARATYGGYSDASAAMQNSALQATRNIDTTNSFAQGDYALLGPSQEFAAEEAALQNRVYPVSTTGQVVSGLGNVFASLAGRNRNSTSSLFG
jgi:cellobiose-specific phosphotransferase system component IIB